MQIINNFKLYLYVVLSLVVGIFIIIFRMRGSKIKELREEINVSKEKFKNKLKVEKFEARNKAKIEETRKHEDIDTIFDGSYSL